MDREIRKQIVKRAIGHYRNLLRHSQRDYEPSLHHLDEHLLRPLCRDFHDILELGTKNDAYKILERFSDECKSLINGKFDSISQSATSQI